MAKIITFGELLLRLGTSDHERFGHCAKLGITFAGAEANVAVALARFGHEAYFVTALPTHDLSARALRELGSHGVNVSGVLHTGGRMGVYFLEGGFAQRPSQVIYDRKDSAFATAEVAQYDWDSLLEGAAWIHLTGITPALSAELEASLPQLAAQARKKGVKVVFDLNYRSKLASLERARAYCTALLAETDLFIASVHQILPVLGVNVDVTSQESAIAAAEEISRKYGVRQVVLTARTTITETREERWSVAYTDGQGGEASQVIGYSILDPLGGGDAFCGGLIAELARGVAIKEAMDFGLAAAAWKYSHHGDYLQGTPTEVRSLLTGSGAKGVAR